MQQEQDGPEGFDQPAVESWIADNVEDLSPPLTWTRLEGGHSNLTYRIDDADGRAAVIRRPPLGELLPKAHDMSREWSVISALDDTPVPVPKPCAFCESPDVTGAWFYVMGLVEGQPIYSAEDIESWVPEERRRQLAESCVDVLAALHEIEPGDVGLERLGKPDGYIGRQLNIWYQSWLASAAPAEYDDPRAHELQRYLLDNVPDQGPGRIVHGDYSLHNLLIDADSAVAAVLDWEICTLGDPLADLGYFLNRWPQSRIEVAGIHETYRAPAGMPPRRELAQRYADKTGRDIAKLDYYVAFNRWKSAAILHGVYARYRAGQKSTEGVDMETLRRTIGDNLTLSEQIITRDGT